MEGRRASCPEHSCQRVQTDALQMMSQSAGAPPPHFHSSTNAVILVPTYRKCLIPKTPLWRKTLVMDVVKVESLCHRSKHSMLLLPTVYRSSLKPVAHREIKLEKKTKLRFSRPSTVLFYFSFRMCERLNKTKFCCVSANHRQHSLTAVLFQSSAHP